MTRIIHADRFWDGMARVIETGPCWIDRGTCQEKVVIGAPEEWYRQDGKRIPGQPIDPKVSACLHSFGVPAYMIDRTRASVRDAEPGRKQDPSQPEYSEGVRLVQSGWPPGSPSR